MEDRLLKFSYIVDSGGFSRAAISLHISQPALTTAVKKLERELGVTLLERPAKKITLTPAGTIAYRAAKELNTHINNLEQRLALLAQARPVVSLGMIDSIADILTGVDDGLTSLRQAADLSLVVDSSTQLTSSVSETALDAAIVVGAPEAPHRELNTTTLGVEPLLAVVHPADQPTYHAALRLRKLPAFLSYNSGSRTQRLIDQALMRQRIRAEPVFYSTSPEVMLKLVLLRQGSAVLPYTMVRQQLSEGSLIAIPLGKEPLARPICAIRLTGRLLPEAVEQLFSTAALALRELTAETNLRAGR